ncbi:penicillin acylase family protein [Streptomyces sp. NPDC052610]|uniref:penicillin acylase family protein n=1 Tax=Streptomyces sp. NPDC052610 TaxID=3154952 RepID=UPI00341D003E
MADRQNSCGTVPFGSSGVPDDSHFADQLTDWQAVRTAPVVTDWERLRNGVWPWFEGYLGCSDLG